MSNTRFSTWSLKDVLMIQAKSGISSLIDQKLVGRQSKRIFDSGCEVLESKWLLDKASMRSDT